MEREGWDVSYCEAAVDDLSTLQSRTLDLVIVLGGPIGVYETNDYPFLTSEIALIEYRLSRDLPTLGICLGSQFMAKALGSRVFKGAVKEIGWGTIELTEEGRSSCLKPLQGDDAVVLHWHGDTFRPAPGRHETGLERGITKTRRSLMAAMRWRFNFTSRPIRDSLKNGMSAIPSNSLPTQTSVTELRAATQRHRSSLARRADLVFGDWLRQCGNSDIPFSLAAASSKERQS